MQALLKISQQTFWQMLGKIVTSVSTFIILGIIARKFGEEGTGVFTLALTYLAIFYLLADFGFNAHVLRKVKRQNSKVKSEWQKLLGTRILWSGVLIVLAVGLLPFWPFTNSQFSQAVLFGSLAIIASGIFVTCNLIFQKELKYNLSVLASSVGTLVYLSLVFLLSQNKTPLPYLTSSFAAGWIFIAILSLFLVKKFVKSLTPVFDFKYTGKLLKDSWPIAVTLVLNVVYFRADAFILAFFKTSAEVGIYNLSYQIFQSALVLPTFIMNSFYPLMIKDYSQNRTKFISHIVRAAALMLVLAIVGTILTIILAPLVIKIITGGKGFAGSVASLQILPLGFPAFFLSAILMWTLVVLKKYKTMLIIYTVGLIFNAIANLIFIPQYSYLAASWVTVISEYLILVMQVGVLRGILIP